MIFKDANGNHIESIIISNIPTAVQIVNTTNTTIQNAQVYVCTLRETFDADFIYSKLIKARIQNGTFIALGGVYGINYTTLQLPTLQSNDSVIIELQTDWQDNKMLEKFKLMVGWI